MLIGIRPDLTCIGKTLGGGLPIAAFGGRADIMAALAPEGPVFVGGTFSGNPTCVAAAHAFLDAIESDEKFFVQIEGLARRLAAGLTAILESLDLRYPVVQCGSMVDFMFRPGMPHRNMLEAKEADAKAYARYYHAMLDQGILLPPSQMELMFVTASHSEADVEATLAAARTSVICELRKFSQNNTPTDLTRFVECWNSEHFFDAHETLEPRWIATRDRGLRGLIQLAAAFHHLSKGNKKGARTTLERAIGRLEDKENAPVRDRSSRARSYARQVLAQLDTADPQAIIASRPRLAVSGPSSAAAKSQ